LDEEGEEDVGCQTHDGKDEEGESAFPRSVLVELVELRRGHVGVLFEVRLGVDLSNVRRRVEEHGEEADPGAKLHLADSLGLGREPLDGGKDLAEEGHNTRLVFGRRTLKARVSLVDQNTAQSDGYSKSNTGDGAQILELSIAKEPENGREIQVASEVTRDIPDANKATSHGIRALFRKVSIMSKHTG
jgi:hypothetical protein